MKTDQLIHTQHTVYSFLLLTLLSWGSLRRTDSPSFLKLLINRIAWVVTKIYTIRLSKIRFSCGMSTAIFIVNSCLRIYFDRLKGPNSQNCRYSPLLCESVVQWLTHQCHASPVDSVGWGQLLWAREQTWGLTHARHSLSTLQIPDKSNS